jgi:hypothetical protein
VDARSLSPVFGRHEGSSKPPRMTAILNRLMGASLAIGLVMALLHVFEDLEFAVIVTIREIFRVHVTRWYIEELALVVVILLVGTTVRALSANQSHLPPWRQVWMWRALTLCVVAAAGAAVVDVARRGLGAKGALIEPAWAGLCVGVLAFICFVAATAVERVLSELLSCRQRVT